MSTQNKRGHEMKTKITGVSVKFSPIKSADSWHLWDGRYWRTKYSVASNYILVFDCVLADSGKIRKNVERRIHVTKRGRFYVTVENVACDVTDFCIGRGMVAGLPKEKITYREPQAGDCRAGMCLPMYNYTPSHDAHKEENSTSSDRGAKTLMLFYKIIIFIILAIFAVVLFYQKVGAAEVSDKLLFAIATVESNNKDSAIGDNGRAFGRYQLWSGYVQDTNRIGNCNYSHNDAKSEIKARSMVVAYLTHYGRRYERITGKKASNEVLARIHNGGPNGWKKSATIKYWNKVKKEIGN